MRNVKRSAADLRTWLPGVLTVVALLLISACDGWGSSVDNEPAPAYLIDPQGLEVRVSNQTVKIGERPTFRPQLFDPRAGHFVGDSLVQEFEYWWQRDGVDISAPELFPGSITLASATLADDGARLKAFARHLPTGHLLVSSDAVLTVINELTPPTILAQPGSVTVGDRDSVAFTVLAGGAPPTYQWLRNGAPVAGANQATLELPLVTFADSGAKFSVVVSNAVGSVTSQEATLTVLDAGLRIARHAGFIAGAGNADGAARDEARFDTPMGLVRDEQGNVYVADTLNGQIRRIDPAGVVSTVAGNRHQKGHADGVGEAALFAAPVALAARGGDLYVADWNHTIRRIAGAATASPQVTTLAGRPNDPGAVDGTGEAARFNAPSGLAFDTAGFLYVTDEASDIIRRIDVATRAVTTYAGRAFAPGALDGDRLAARFNGPRGLHIDLATDLMTVADSGNHTVRTIDRLGAVRTLAGVAGVSGYNNGAASQALFASPAGVMFFEDGTYVADSNNHVIRRIVGGQVQTVAGTGTAGGNDGQRLQARFDVPSGLADGGSRQLLIADLLNHAVRVLPTGAEALPVSTLAGQRPQPGSTDGHWSIAAFRFPSAVAGTARDALLIADTGNSTLRRLSGNRVATLAGEAGSAGTVDGAAAQARFDQPAGVAMAGNGVAWVTQRGAVRRVDADGAVTTLATTATSGGLLARPQGIAFDANGEAYVADRQTHRILRVSPAGNVTAVAGSGAQGSADGAGSAAQFDTPVGVAMDLQRNVLYVADSANHVIRRVAPNGVVETFAGTAGQPGRADGGGAAARFREPVGVAVGRDGAVYVADRGNHTIRRISPAGEVTTVVGQAGVAGYAQGQLPGLLARPEGIAVIGTSLFVTMEHGVAEIRNYP